MLDYNNNITENQPQKSLNDIDKQYIEIFIIIILLVLLVLYAIEKLYKKN